MPPIRRRLRVAALSLSALAAAGAPALAQNESSNTIGPPQLKDFSLPGQRTTPPAAPAPAPPAPAPRPSTQPSERPAAPTTLERPAERRPDPPASARTDRPTARTAPAPEAAAPIPSAEPAGPARAVPETVPEPLPEPQAPAAVPEAEPPVAAAPAETRSGGPGWLWPAAGAALLLAFAAFFGFRRRSARIEREAERDSARDELGSVLTAPPETEPRPAPAPAPAPESKPRSRPEPALAPAPIPAAEPAPGAEAPAPPRPWLELDIAPERAAATDSEVYVRYALTLTNRGEVEARNIRIDPRLFNAGAEGEMLAFFQGPIHDLSGSPHVVVAPGGSLKLNGQVAMPNAELREIELGGRRIFVPMVAINVAYDWAGGGSGRTSRSWLVGREADVPTEKMGPFRLDLGPRIYRSVGRREARLVMV